MKFLHFPFFFFLLLLISSCGRLPPPAQEPPQRWVYKPPIQQRSELIVLDPGHGDQDPGASSLRGDFCEKDLNLTTACLVREQLAKRGFPVIMTRSTDTFLPLKERAEVANRAKATLFVSIHFNAAENHKAHGVEVYRYRTKEPGEREKESQRLAEGVLSEIIQETQANNRGVKEANFAVLRCTEMPAILVEGGFMTHEEEMERLRQSEYLEKIAEAIALGIEAYFLHGGEG